MNRVERVEVLPAPPETVWPTITEPAELSQWFEAEVLELGLRPGGRIVMRESGAIRRARVLEIERPVRLLFRWLLFQVAEEGDVEPVPGTTVEVVLEEVPEGTRIQVSEWGPTAEAPAGAGPIFTLEAPPEPRGAPPRIMLWR
ncbi:MAG: SRPBCC domain-containing protein [Actinomycetota bacterium]